MKKFENLMEVLSGNAQLDWGDIRLRKISKAELVSFADFIFQCYEVGINPLPTLRKLTGLPVNFWSTIYTPDSPAIIAGETKETRGDSNSYPGNWEEVTQFIGLPSCLVQDADESVKMYYIRRGYSSIASQEIWDEELGDYFTRLNGDEDYCDWSEY